MNNTSEGINKVVVASAAEEEQQCRIIYIPDKPPVPPHLQPTVNVHAAVIEPKHANTLVRKLNQIAPLEKLRHVKRVRKKSQDGGKNELSVILCLASESDSELDGAPNDVLELIKQYQLSTFVAKVCRYAASTKEEWDEQCKFWPTSYHPPTYNISGITGFSKEDTKSVFGFMKYAVDLARSCSNLVVNAAVIVDPSTKQVISSACDQDLSRTGCKFKTNMETNCFKHEPFTPTSTSESENHQTLFASHVSNLKGLHICVSCLHPWGWTEQQLPESSISWHPLRHAAMVAIEHSAARDRLLYPDSGHSGAEMIEEGYLVPSSTGLPSKRQKINFTQDGNDENLDWKTNALQSDSAKPYLCTGYDIYLVWEPCTMCAMALVHQRVKRIFYALPNPNAGALGSVHRLQGERSLNHHYAVFRVLLPEEMVKDETLVSIISNNYQIKT
ncbi:tRNA-specific adenosine deaminase TAD3 [Coffea eugenioides]|uniref:tRNA-specific adenosine deaminase TAD3 n=1 Tax=Coffea eugenioides TaxID=49369 RepID=UPI000F6046AA|nr:tRNA-specific adenosine deaminase TAD3 [Coffea eugenioides]